MLIIKLKFDGCYIFEGEISESCAESSMDVRPGRYTVLTFFKLCLRRLMPRKDKKGYLDQLITLLFHVCVEIILVFCVLCKF